MSKRVQGEAKQNRKQQGYTTPHGPSILESVETQLRKAIASHHKAMADEHPQQTKVDQTRGVVRGLAFAVLTIRSPYAKNQKRALLQIESEFGL